MGYYSNKVVWVTGASSGIGESLVHEFLKEGAYVILSSRRKDELQRVVLEAGATADRFKILELDLRDHPSLKPKTDEAVSWKGHIDILINNGGVSQRSLAQNTTLEVEKGIFDVNYFGTIELTRNVVPFMIERGMGHINVVSSVLGKIAVPGRSTYCATKHALQGYFDALRSELHGQGIRVSVVCPGYIHTNVSKNAVTADGNPHNITDKTHQKAMSSDVFSRKMLKKIARGRNEFYIGGPEVFSVYMMRWFPWLVFRVQRLIKFKG